MPSLINISENPMSGDIGDRLDSESMSKIDPLPEKDSVDGSTTTSNSEELSIVEQKKESNSCAESQTLNDPTMKQSAEAAVNVSSDGKPLKTFNSAEPGSDDNNNASESSPPNKKRRVTPDCDSCSKQNQQKKVNQMTLSSFFYQGKLKATESTTYPKTTDAKKLTITVENKAKSSPTNTSPCPDQDLTNNKHCTMSKKDKTPIKNEGNIEIINIESDNDNDNDDTQMNIEKETEDKETASSGKEKGNIDAGGARKNDMPSISVASSNRTIQDTEVFPQLVLQQKDPTTLIPASQNDKQNTASRKSSARKKKSSSKKAPTSGLSTGPKKFSMEELPEERRTLIQRHNKMKEKYLSRTLEHVTLYRNGIDEEKDFRAFDHYPIKDENEIKLPTTENDCEEFPTQVVIKMSILIEGSDLPLSALVSKICAELETEHGFSWSSEAVCAKIKLLSQRRSYFDVKKKCVNKVVDVFEDNDRNRLWRWEITTLDLLDSEIVSQARKARIARKKISSYHSALLKLVKSLEDAEKQIMNPDVSKLDNVTAKINGEEEKVLKFERESEKQRLAEQARARKLSEQIAKRKAKEEAAEEKRKKKEAEAEKKKETSRIREEEKRRKEKEKVRKDEEKKMEEKQELAKITKQKASFRSFFAAPKRVVSKQKEAKAITTHSNATCQTFDLNKFRAKINASNHVQNLALNKQNRSASAVACRKRRARRVDVSVYKTVTPEVDDAWDAPSYLEQRTIKVPNKYRFLSFHENCRPAYHGTWSKSSSVITGKNPFKKDNSVFDYDYDSEGEWEEGDDEMGEDVEDEAKNLEEDEAEDAEGNAKMYDFDDGFCVADDRLLDNEENADEDTKALYKKKMLNRKREQHNHANRISIIAPGLGGIPLNMADSKSLNTDRTEGIDRSNLANYLSSYKALTISNVKPSLDAFPQSRMNEDKPAETSANGNGNKDEYTAEDTIKMARFTHHSTLNSKDKVIEELRVRHPTVFSIRAKATRKLDAIAVKKKHPNYTGGSVYWEVKTEVLAELGLTDILGKKLEDIVYDNATSCIRNLESKSLKGVNERKRKAPKQSSSDKNSSKKKKVSMTGKAKATPKLTSRGKGGKSSPRKGKDEAVSVGMKNLMADFVKKSTPKQPTSTSPAEKSNKTSASSCPQ